MKITLRPNVHDPIVTLVGHSVLSRVDELGVYSYAVVGNEGPNTFDQLAAVGAWDLAPVAVEMGALNEHETNLDHFIREMKTVKGKLGSRMVAVDVDETLFKMRHRRPGGTDDASPRQVARWVAPFYKRGQELGLGMRLIEPYPALSLTGELMPFLEMLDALGAPVSTVVLDIDWNALMQGQSRLDRIGERLTGFSAYWEHIEADLASVVLWCKDTRRQFAVMLGSPTGPNVRTEGQFVDYASAVWDALSQIVTPDHVMVQSFEALHHNRFGKIDSLARIVDKVKGQGGSQ